MFATRLTPPTSPTANVERRANAITRAAALEFAEHGIRVNAVMPGLIELHTERHGYTAPPEQIGSGGVVWVVGVQVQLVHHRDSPARTDGHRGRHPACLRPLSRTTAAPRSPRAGRGTEPG